MNISQILRKRNFLSKPSIVIYISNFFAFIIFRVLHKLLPKPVKPSIKSLLFINSGQIGDLIVSSLLFENELELSEKYSNITLVIRNEYKNLFGSYEGKFKIICYNHARYKWNISYKIDFLTMLRKSRFSKCFNLTAARGVLNDEMALLSGSEEIFALNSDWKYLKKIFGKKMDSYYSKILAKNIYNEYEKHQDIFILLLSNPVINFTERGNKQLFSARKLPSNISNLIHTAEPYIVIAPFSSDNLRHWDIEKYNILIEKIVRKSINVVMIGTNEQQSKLKLLECISTRVFILPGTLELNDIPVLLKESILFIGLDSGITHISLRLGIPTIGLIGAGMYNKFLPSPLSKSRVKYLYQECNYLGCEWKCKFSEKKCITDITVDAVFAEVLNLIN